ncbi:hypothetical protein VTH8203_04594 [Vibrio thalassae]|uniref:Uncharacterized protein n=1 Tax=Vibrio thalassae TaxID=1243014 RepID=A0A240ERE5_9VIBR|nr:hypothetical protein VTH8203_04594 [Vibrio thalassae]
MNETVYYLYIPNAGYPVNYNPNRRLIGRLTDLNPYIGFLNLWTL